VKTEKLKSARMS